MPQAVHRTPRMRPAGPDRTQFDVPALPTLEPPARLQPVQLLLPVLGSLSILVYGLMARTPVLLVTGGVLGLPPPASPVGPPRLGGADPGAELAPPRRRP